MFNAQEIARLISKSEEKMATVSATKSVTAPDNALNFLTAELKSKSDNTSDCLIHNVSVKGPYLANTTVLNHFSDSISDKTSDISSEYISQDISNCDNNTSLNKYSLSDENAICDASGVGIIDNLSPVNGKCKDTPLCKYQGICDNTSVESEYSCH